MIESKTVWQLFSVSSLMIGANFFVKPDAAVAAGFSQTCAIRSELTNFGGAAVMTGACRKRDGGMIHASLSLSNWIANYEGNLSWANPIGRFNGSCKDYKVVRVEVPGRPYFLKANCERFSGDKVGNDTVLNLNGKISNQDGVLDYDD